MSSADTALTITGNLTGDRELRVTGILCRFAVPEASSVANWRGDASPAWRPGPWVQELTACLPDRLRSSLCGSRSWC